jgi:hypothetical protein
LADRNAIVKANGMVETDSSAIVIAISEIKQTAPKSASKISIKKRRRDFAARNQISEYMPKDSEAEPQMANFYPSDAGQGILTE